MTCWRIDGKVVAGDAVIGTALRIGRRGALERLDARLPALTNVRLRLRYPHGAESGDIYGKVTAHAPSAPSWAPAPHREAPRASDGAAELTRIHFTSITDEDRDAVDRLVAASAGAAEAGSPA
jgi:hypothetical protein